MTVISVNFKTAPLISTMLSESSVLTLISMNLIVFVGQDRFFLTHVKDRAEFLARKGFNVHVLGEKTSDRYVKQIERLGFKFYDTKIRRDAINPVEALWNFINVISIYRRIRPDVVFHLGAKAIFFGTVSAKLLGNSVSIVNAPIGLGHLFICKTTRARILRNIVTFLYKLLLCTNKSKVIVENQDDINFFIGLGAVKKEDIFLIPGAGIDTELFIPSEKINCSKTCTIIMVARLIKEKGIYEFIASAEMSYEERLPLKFIVVGSPDGNNPSSLTRAEYENLLKNPAIECVGFTENVLPLLQRADIACLPSYREGLPRSLIEACSCGLPIVTTDTVGCREIVINNNGLIVPVGDKEALFNAIKTLAFSEKLRRNMGMNSRNIAVQRFETNKISEQTYNVMELLLKKQSVKKT